MSWHEHQNSSWQSAGLEIGRSEVRIPVLVRIFLLRSYNYFHLIRSLYFFPLCWSIPSNVPSDLIFGLVLILSSILIPMAYFFLSYEIYVQTISNVFSQSLLVIYTHIHIQLYFLFYHLIPSGIPLDYSEVFYIYRH